MKRFGIRGRIASALFLCMAMVFSITQAFAWGKNACPLTQGFWKNHFQDWEVTGLTIGGISYDNTELLNILETPPSGGNAALILAHQLIAADLNLALGSTNNVGPTITDANTLLADNCSSPLPGCFVAASSTAGALMTADANVLDEFNSGNLNKDCVPATFPG
jgi:hypothetical protein